MRYLASAALAATTAFAAMTSTAGTAEARRWHHGAGIGLGIAGAVLGGIALSRYRYYDDPYYYDSYYDDYPYYYGRPYRRAYYSGFYGGPRRFYGGGHHYRRGGGGPAWGVRGHGWGGRHRH